MGGKEGVDLDGGGDHQVDVIMLLRFILLLSVVLFVDIYVVVLLLNQFWH